MIFFVGLFLFENIIRLDKGQLERLKKEMEDRLAIINEDAQISVDEQLMSLNLIKILWLQ